MSGKFPFKPINTGQQWPEGIDLHDGQCERCGRKGKITRLRLIPVGMKALDPIECCAECMADFIVLPEYVGKVCGQRNGEWIQMKGKLR